MMKSKFLLIVLLISVIFLASCAPQPAEEIPAAEKEIPSETERDDFGCWPPSCSVIPDPQGKQTCEDWKAGKAIQWQSDCNSLSAQPACVKLCEFEKKNNPPATEVSKTADTSAKQDTASGSVPSQTGRQEQSFNTLPSLVKAEFASGVSEEDKNSIIQGISAMDFYLKQW